VIQALPELLEIQEILVDHVGPEDLGVPYHLTQILHPEFVLFDDAFFFTIEMYKKMKYSLSFAKKIRFFIIS
jgi:hypothetical protein